jgi:predicted membrane protein
MSQRKATRGEAILFLAVLTMFATGLTVHGLGYRLSLVLGLSIFAFIIAILALSQVVE